MKSFLLPPAGGVLPAELCFLLRFGLKAASKFIKCLKAFKPKSRSTRNGVMSTVGWYMRVRSFGISLRLESP